MKAHLGFSRLQSVTIVSSLVLTIWHQQVLGQGDGELKRRFLKEAPSQWKEYVRLSEELQGFVSVSISDTIGGPGESQRRLEYKVDFPTNGGHPVKGV